MEYCDDFIFEDANVIEESNYSRKVKIYKKRINPFEYYSDNDFEELYRFDKETAMNIVNTIREDLTPMITQKGAPISPEIMVMATIRYKAKGSYQKDIADAHGISQQSMTNIIRKVTAALASKMKNYISFPTNFEDIRRLKAGFYKIASFPQCIGVIDGTHIKIKNPGGELGGRHRCRKGFYSINVQVICDSSFRIMDIVARWRGSAHDSRIWRESTIKSKLEQIDTKGGILLGDNGYANSTILLTPFKSTANLTTAEKKYNEAHIKTRNTIEKLFGQLKNKFRCCLNGISVDINTTKNIIVAIAVLFNISKENNTQFASDNLDAEYEGVEDEEVRENTPGVVIRQNFINKYFQ